MLFRTFYVLFLTIALSACEEQANPFIGEEQPFSVYGYLNPKSSTQLVRVIPVAGTIDALSPPTIDASVVSINLDTGEQRAWKDSLVTFDSLNTGHLFVSHFTPPYGATYRLEVARSDGAVAHAQVTVPEDITVRPRISESSPLLLPFFLEGDERPNVVQADMEYIAAALQPAGMNPILYPVSVSYRGEDRTTSGGREIVADIRRDYAEIREAFDRNCLTTEYIGVRSMRFVIFIGDASWVPPGDEFDEDVLVQPDLFSNVENGFGFFGAGYPLRFNAIQQGSILQSAGFALDPPCDPSFASPTDPSCRVIPPCFGEGG